MTDRRLPGPRYLGDGRCEFLFWAPRASKPELSLCGKGAARRVPLERLERGYWSAGADGVEPGTPYRFRFRDGREHPDPASRHQPKGVHEASSVVDHAAFRWTDAGWRGIPLHELVMYELHVGTFTPEGTFDAIVPRLPELREIGINALELMPVAQFPGERNWGYDGVYPYAVQDSYGGPEGLKRLVDACHREGIAIFLDVVYNHLGPEGNYLEEFGPYFTDRYRTPWGKAVNFDGPDSDEVREYFVGNALHWFADYHVDGLRVDAVHAIADASARPFLQELCSAVEAFGRTSGRSRIMIAESDLNDTKTIRSSGTGGHGFDAQWLDDFHHCVHTLLTGERNGYYADYGRVEDFAKCLREGFVYSGQHSRFRRRSHGNPSGRFPPEKFVVFSKNHDQIGNRLLGERMTALVPPGAVRLQLAATMLSPYVPLIFMGEEYGETAPFRYFVSHTDPGLIRAVREGRREEFRGFRWEGELPDPQDEREFLDSRISWRSRGSGAHLAAANFFRALAALRRELGPVRGTMRRRIVVTADPASGLVAVRRPARTGQALLLFNFNAETTALHHGVPPGRWRLALDTNDHRWGGGGSKLSAALGAGDPVAIAPHSAAVFVAGSAGAA